MSFQSACRRFIKQNALALTACGLPFSAFHRQDAPITVADLPPATLEKFASTIKGQIVVPGNTGYRSAGQLWNGAMPKQPGLIVKSSDTGDVVASVNFARE